MSMTTGVRLDDETKTRLKTLAEARERSAHWLIKKAVAEFLDREEALDREQAEDAARWQQFQETGDSIPHQDVAAWLDTWGSDQDAPWRRK